MKIPDINILAINEVAGVTVSYTSQTTYTISFCQIQKKKGEVHIKKIVDQVSTILELKALVPKNVPVLLNISGKVVLNKEFDANTESGARTIPVNQPDDFYTFAVEGEATSTVSICRKIIVDELLTEFTKAGIQVINMSLGPYLASALWNYQLVMGTEIPVSNGSLRKNNINYELQFVAENDNNNNEVSVAGQQVPANQTLSYTIALIYLLKGYDGELAENRPEHIVEGYQYKHIIAKTKFLVLGVIFLTLIINFLSFDSIRKKEAQITGQLQLNSGILAKRDSLETILQAKENFIDYIGSNKTYYSYFLDEIASTVPSKIALNKLEINPLEEKIQKKEAIKVKRKILITGVAGSSLVLNQWINKLEKLNWTKEVVVINYIRNEDTGKGEFLIEVIIKK